MSAPRRVKPDPQTKESAARRAIALVSDGSMSAQRACELIAAEEGVTANAVRSWAREIDGLFGRRIARNELPTEIAALRLENDQLRRQTQELALELQELRRRFNI